MNFYIKKLTGNDIHSRLREIPHPPEELYSVGSKIPENALFLSIIGSRNHSLYGEKVCKKLIRGLKDHPIVIVSGLARGLDAVAHKSALEVGLPTVAILGSGLSEEALYPKMNRPLAKEILRKGGTLISEYEPTFKATKWSFPKRNRLIAGLAHVVLVIEAAHKSGTLITAHLATDYNREVAAVPGPITSDISLGTNLLIKQGATPITQAQDILDLFEMKQETLFDEPMSEAEEKLLTIIPYLPEKKDLKRHLHFSEEVYATLLIKGLISEKLGKVFLTTK